MATSGALALAAGTARADTDAFAAAFDSVGTVTGDEMQLPMDSPVSVCGDTVNAEGLLDPEAGSTCEDREETRASHGDGSGTSRDSDDESDRESDREGGHDGGATALAGVIGSPGGLSDDGVRLPVDLPVKVSGDAVSIVAFDESDFDDSGESGGKPPAQDVTPPEQAAPPAGDEPGRAGARRGGARAGAGPDPRRHRCRRPRRHGTARGRPGPRRGAALPPLPLVGRARLTGPPHGCPSPPPGRPRGLGGRRPPGRPSGGAAPRPPAGRAAPAPPRP
ncbi:chaplin [Streptomyces somaliensis]|uniref:chaplin n=1 Tax=Streptomyces somaliensis TaxID=78355 RepID=UPI0020CC7C4B|nr:chaplin [Streptomyces somaliensis]MCP9946231.1 chaplin [Streptomyces somaliensis]